MPGSSSTRSTTATPVQRVEVGAFTVPTDAPESDGTFEWEQTTIVVVRVAAGHVTGTGYTYADASAGVVIERDLVPVVVGRDLFDIESSYAAMVQAVRNIGRQGIAATAISAVDIALWDAKAQMLDLPLVSLLGAARAAVPVYGSGGFTSYSIERLQAQLGGWAQDGLRAVKMKVGRDAASDVARVRAAREAIGGDVQLFVDANGGYDRKQALGQAGLFAACDVRWFEEPVSSDDLGGLRLIRDRAPAGMDIAAGEYGYDPQYFRRMVEAGAVDVLQADATRCGGITGFLRAAALCDAAGLPLSAHTAPGVHIHPCCAAPRIRNLEYFHDHVRIERLLFDGTQAPVDGALHPDRSRPGLGLVFKPQDARQFAV